MEERVTTESDRARRILETLAIVSAFVIATMFLRGQSIAEWNTLNPDEAELMAEARVAVHSPVPFSTWITGTNGPYSVLFLAGLLALRAPATPVFAHLLSAILLALTASALLFSASRVIGRKPAVAFTLVWWFPIAAIFLIGSPADYGAMSTEYLPVLLIVVSALITRKQLAARPWLFGVIGLLAGLAIGAKYQVGPVAVAFATAQVIVLRPNKMRIAAAGLAWLIGAVLPIASLAAVMVFSSATDWSLVDQASGFLGNYVARSPLDKLLRTVVALLMPGVYLLVLLACLTCLCRRSDRHANVGRLVLVGSGFAAMLVAGMGFPHYNLILFGAIALAATMPTRSDTGPLLQQVSTVKLSGALGATAAVFLLIGQVSGHWAPLSPRAAVSSLSSDSVLRNSTFTRACPPGSPALVWGWASEIYLFQNWSSTVPYQVIVPLRWPLANREMAEPLVRAGIDRAACVVDATKIKTPPPNLALPDMVLNQFYPRLELALRSQFHIVPIAAGCDGCILYVRNTAPNG